jgi:hypothetical protein
LRLGEEKYGWHLGGRKNAVEHERQSRSSVRGKAGLVSAKKLLADGGQFCIVFRH